MSNNNGVQGTLDHFMIGSSDLRRTVESFERITGVKPVFGGDHPSWGTRNYLVGLGGTDYLEFLGAHPEAPVPADGLPFGLGAISGTGFLTWAVGVPDLSVAMGVAQSRDLPLGGAMKGQRATPEGDVLSWQLSAPQPDPSSVTPFLIQWDQDPDANRGEGSGARLSGVEIFHPEPDRTAADMRFLGINYEVHAGPALVVPTIETPLGSFALDAEFWKRL